MTITFLSIKVSFNINLMFDLLMIISHIKHDLFSFLVSKIKDSTRLTK